MAVPVSFFHLERATLEVVWGLIGGGGGGRELGGDWHEETGDTPIAPAIRILK